MDSPEFRYATFCSLNGPSLVEYMEGFVNDPSTSVPADDLERMATELNSYDEYHQVYAIELGMDRMPTYFAPFVLSCLSSDKQSVRLAAHRRLSQLETISEELVHACEKVVSLEPQYEDVSDIVTRLCQLPRR